MENLGLKTGKSNFRFTNISYTSGRQLHSPKRELVIVEEKHYQFLEEGEEEKVNI